MTDRDAIVASWGRDWRSALVERTPAERSTLLAEAARAVVALQEAARAGARAGHALHRKTLLESADAAFDISPDLPEPLRIGPFVPGASWPAVLRLSSAFPIARSDELPDQRGLAVRIGAGDPHLDLLATTGEAHHARDAKAMIASLGAAASAARGGVAGRVGALATLVGAIGVRDGLRLVRTIAHAAQAGVSVAALTFYSRAPFQLGAFAVRYRFAPVGGPDNAVRATGPDALGHDLQQRLAVGPLRWSFELQGYRDARSTPMDDHRIAWQSPWLGVATLTVRGTAAPIVPLAFRATPSWPDATGVVLAPLGDLNLLRDAAYAASQSGRTDRH